MYFIILIFFFVTVNKVVYDADVSVLLGGSCPQWSIKGVKPGATRLQQKTLQIQSPLFQNRSKIRLANEYYKKI